MHFYHNLIFVNKVPAYIIHQLIQSRTLSTNVKLADHLWLAPFAYPQLFSNYRLMSALAEQVCCGQQSSFFAQSIGGGEIFFINFGTDFEKHVTGIYLTASTDGIKDDGSQIANFFKTKAINYATSTKKLGTCLPGTGKAIPQVISTHVQWFCLPLFHIP